LTTMKDKAFHRWYKRLIENGQQIPPDQVWENISLELDREFYDWYRSRVEDPGKEPPETVWNNIEDHLDSSLHHAYKAGVENPAEEPPPWVWQNIEQELSEEDFHQWYKQRVETPAYEPSEKVWNNIQDELDVDNTWHRIRKKLDRNDKSRNRALIYAAAAVALLFIVIQVFSPFPDQSPFNSSLQSPVAEQQEEKEVQPDRQPGEEAIQPDPPAEKMAGSRTKEQPQEPGLAETTTTPAVADSTSLASDAGASTQTPVMLAKAEPIRVQLEGTHDQDLGGLPQTSVSSYEEERIEPSSSPHHYYVGLNGELGNSWLLSNKTIHSIRNSPYSAASPQLSKSYGLVAGTSLNDRLDLQLEALITNETGQNYREYTGGQVLNNHIRLNYSSLKVTGRYEVIPSSFQLPLSHHILLGTYGSYLKDARQKTAGESENIRPAYKNYNIGMVLGYELDTHIAPNYTLSAGIRYNPGFINIYEGTAILPARFNKTYSSSVNLNISLKYNFSVE